MPEWRQLYCESASLVISKDSNRCPSVDSTMLSLPQDVVGGYTCRCEIGYTGDDCETEINECANSPCENGGSCNVCMHLPLLLTTSLSKFGCSLLTKLLSPLFGLQDLIGTYSCDCLPAYTGDDCDEEVDECQPNPCVNGGTCHVS